MKYNLFLDDQRHPKDAFLYDSNKTLSDASGISPVNWEIVRSYDEFVKCVNKFGIPDVVAFDHDLSFEHMRYYMLVTQETGVIEYEKLKEKTGKHCAEFLVEKILESGTKNIPKFFIHSANEYGRAEIRKVLKKLNYDK